MELSQCDWVELVFHLFSGDVFNFGRLCRSNKRMIREDGTNQSDPRHFNESKDLQHKPISTTPRRRPGKNNCCLQQQGMHYISVTKLLLASIRITYIIICVIRLIFHSDNIINHIKAYYVAKWNTLPSQEWITVFKHSNIKSSLQFDIISIFNFRLHYTVSVHGFSLKLPWTAFHFGHLVWRNNKQNSY